MYFCDFSLRGVKPPSSRHLGSISRPMPGTAEGWISKSQEFSFPHGLGAINGKHITIQSPSHSGSEYFNYKWTFSVVLLTVVDNNYNDRSVFGRLVRNNKYFWETRYIECIKVRGDYFREWNHFNKNLVYSKCNISITILLSIPSRISVLLNQNKKK